MDQTPELLAADVGNSRVKLGVFGPSDPCGLASATSLPIAPSPLPEPGDTLAGGIERLVDDGALAAWLDEWFPAASPAPRVVIGSVSPPASDRLAAALHRWGAERGTALEVTELRPETMPLVLRVEEPTKLGVDRAAAAIAANRLRRPGSPAIVVDAGTAITVDLVAADGAYEGGAILAGLGMSARAMHEQTAALPLIDFAELDGAPPALGKTTVGCIQAGLFWGAVGGIRETIARLRDGLTVAPQVFLTGGSAPSVARLLAAPDYTVRFVPHLTLAGVALSLPPAAGES
ncbi:MAG: type III pantothenate kinase [Lacipirellulaceae bacterium]